VNHSLNALRHAARSAWDWYYKEITTTYPYRGFIIEWAYFFLFSAISAVGILVAASPLIALTWLVEHFFGEF
jgi:hypothetical protein